MHVAVKGWCFFLLIFFPQVNAFPVVDGRIQSFQKLAEQIKSEFCSCHRLDFPNPSQLSLNECHSLSYNSSAANHAGSSKGSNFLRGLDSQINFNKKLILNLVFVINHTQEAKRSFPFGWYWNQTKQKGDLVGDKHEWNSE